MLKYWTGDWGDAYTDRQPASGDEATSLRSLLAPWLSDIHTVLEVGCNRGGNLPAFHDKVVKGVEPNDYARRLAWKEGYDVQFGLAHNIPYPDKWFDLVYTCGVLIHVPPFSLKISLQEIYRVSKRYILAVEYDADEPTPVDYRGVRAGIWKRPYGQEYLDRFPDLRLVGSGQCGEEFDGCKWWILEKSGR